MNLRTQDEIIKSWKNSNQQTLVSIICLTYNHENYIADCLNSFLSQKTNFKIEIIVHDDASTDKTPCILKKYQDLYPMIISPIYEKENQYSKNIDFMKNIILPKVNGNYIAFCEGDDYWCDDFKLQKQIDALQTNKNYVFSYSKFKLFYEKENRFSNKIYGTKPPSLFVFVKDFRKWEIHTATIVINKQIYFDYLKKVNPGEKQWRQGDMPLYCYILGLANNIHYLDECTTIYRILNNSLSQTYDYNKYNLLRNSEENIKEFFHSFYEIGNYKRIPEQDIEKQFFYNKLNKALEFNTNTNRYEAIVAFKNINNKNFKLYIFFFILHFSFLTKMLAFKRLIKSKK